MDENCMVGRKSSRDTQTADTHNSKKLYDELKGIHGPQSHGTALLRKADNFTLITHPEGILKCLAEHFDSVLSHPSTTADQAIDVSPQYPTCHELDIPPFLAE